MATTDPPIVYKVDSIKDLGKESYFFSIGKHDAYKFEWVDKKKHIARWSIYYDNGSIFLSEIYVDSLYNIYPTVHYIIEDD